MRRALQLARLGHGRVHPNPMVGAVVVRAGRIVGEGCHEAVGGPHAEVQALRAAGAAAAGATLYVTLEPCSHHGRTPPCTDAIIAAGVRTVVFAADDPNVQAGGGAALLRQAGLELRSGVDEEAARALNPAFFHCHEHHTTYVALKLALSLDGRIAAGPGQRTRLTGAAANAEVHRLRASHDAVLIGSGTAMADDPLLTVRGIDSSHRPVRIVVDSTARLDPASALVRTIPDAPLWILCAPGAPAERVYSLQDAGADIIPCAPAPAGVDMAAALRELRHRGIFSVLVEGGSAITASLLRAQLLQRMHLFFAPQVLGAAGVNAFDAPLLQAWRCTDSLRLDDDVLVSLAPVAEAR